MTQPATMRAVEIERMTTPPDASAPAVLKIVYHVRPGKRETFEKTLRSMVEAGKTSPGRLGVDVIKPAPGSEDPDEWVVVLRYRTEADLCAWRQSRTVRKTRAHLDALTVGAPRVERVNGMETWFSLADRRDVLPAPKWKMAIASIIAIYPLILFIQPAVAPLVRGTPRWLAILIEMLLITPLMTWVVLPLVIRLLKAWLYPDGSQTKLQPSANVRPTGAS